MNDNRFIELVNLYVDREISSAETAELEAEIQANPRRRAIYNQYCKMNRATSLVYESFRAQAAEPVAEVKEGGSIAKFETAAQRRRRSSWGYYAGGMVAAAACVAFVFAQVNRTGVSTPAKEGVPVIAQSAAPVAQVAASTPAATTEVRTNFVSLRNANEAAQQNYATLLTTLREEQQRSLADAQLNQSMRTPSLFEDGVFDAKPAVNNRMFRSAQPTAQQAEFTAFQFQR